MSSETQAALASAARAPNSPGATHIRSFVHRRGHITQGQQAALERLMGQWSIPYAPRRLDPAAAFGREAPTVLEIGFGMGETTEKIALARPDDNFLGVEVFNAGVGSLLRRIEDSSIQNLRIIQHDAVEVVRDMIAPDSLAGVHVYFPDPWPRSGTTSAGCCSRRSCRCWPAASRRAATFTARRTGKTTRCRCWKC